MPTRPNRPCSQPGCPGIAQPGSSRCASHQQIRAQQDSRISPSARGYDRNWQQIRAQQDSRISPSARGYDRNWQRIRAQFLRRYPECMMCGAPATDVDHVLPLRRGGTHDESNLQALCHGCHSRKTATYDNSWGRGG